MQGIESYEENSDTLVVEQFVQTYHQLVRKIALHLKRRLPSYIDLDDLFQAGFVGLLEARNHYKEDMGAAFETYASIRIRGAMIDSLRKNSWGTRETMKNMRRISEAITKIEQREHKHPSTEDIAAELGISVDEHLAMCQQISISNIISLDALETDHNSPTDDAENPGSMAEKSDLIQHIKTMLQTLPEREQIVLSLYYMEEFTFKQIGEILDLTEARICQLHSQAISRIQSKIKNESAE